MFELLSQVFGDLFGNFPRELFIIGNMVSSGGPRADLAQTRGKRIMSTNELTPTEKKLI